VPFNEPKKLICGHMPSEKFFTGLFARHSQKLTKKTKQKMDAKRAARNCDAVVEAHFEGIHGLRRALLECGIMDEDGKIKDKRRIVNLDETPQFVDFADNKGNQKKKFAAWKNDLCLNVSHEKRECNTVMMCWGLDGSIYGLQIIVARKTLTESLAIDAFGWFDGTIMEDMKFSKFGMISNDENGVQTAATFLDRLKMLDEEFKLEIFRGRCS